MKDCIFCKIIKKEIPCYKIWEDDDFLAFLDINPVNLGHTLIIPKKHYENIFDLPINLLEKCGPVIQKVSKAVLGGTKASGLNIGMNNGETAGQLVFHTHFHLIPRFENDELKLWKSRENITEKNLKEISNEIKKQIN